MGVELPEMGRKGGRVREMGKQRKRRKGKKGWGKDKIEPPPAMLISWVRH